ncbi:hypothetical protein [Oecophyllibacter saccharovorans]|nr:hypothetical protein [Oecophyllibacter saccharovorans]
MPKDLVHYSPCRHGSKHARFWVSLTVLGVLGALGSLAWTCWLH